jgi:hypothetical protein
MTTEPRDERREDDALRALLRDASREPAPAALDEIFEKVRDEVAHDDARPLARLRGSSTRARRAIAIASFVGIFCFAALTGTRPDLALYPTGRLALECAAYAVLIVLTIFAAVRSEAMPLLSRTKALALVAVGLVAAVVLATLPAPHTLPIHLVGHSPSPAFPTGSPCMYLGLLLGIPVYAVLRLVDRGSPLSSVLAASTAGLVANLVLQVHCPVTSVGHRLVGHASIGPILLACLGAALLFERIVMAKRPD